jgi:hypothetical protein
MKPVKKKCSECSVVNNEFRCAMCKWKTEEWVQRVRPRVVGNNDNFMPKEEKK